MKKHWQPVLMAFASLTVGLAPGGAGAGYLSTVVMSGLDNPRGLAFGPDGALYVTEAGRGGSGPSIVLGDGVTNSYGATGALSRLQNGVQERVLAGLPSLAPVGGARATGLHDIAFSASGEAFGLVGFGGDPTLRSSLGSVGAQFGSLVRLPLAGGTVQPISDVAAHEASQNPGGAELNSNPYGLLAKPGGGFTVADAGANAILGVAADGAVSTLSVLPPRPNPLPFGPPVFASVPTAVALGPEGATYIGELTGFPFPQGAANVYRLDPLTGVRSLAFAGFTNIIDLTFGPDGSLYVLQITTNGLASPNGPGSGALFRIDSLTGVRTTIASDGLSFPSGVAIGPDGDIYISNRGTSPGDGEVLRLTSVPEPSTIILATLGLGGLLGFGRRPRKPGPAAGRV